MNLLTYCVGALIILSTPSLSRTIHTTIADHLGQPRFSYQGRQIPLSIYQSDPQAKHPAKFLIQGGLHGNEKETSRFIMWLTANTSFHQWNINNGKGVEIHFLPVTNPDTFAQNRYNANSVNLNRNFSVLWGLSKEPPGRAPFSEPETQAIRAMSEAHHYIAAIDIHGYVNWIVTPSSPKALPYPEKNYLIEAYRQWIDIVREKTPKLLPNYLIKTAESLGDGGSFEDWSFWERKAFSVCLELSAPKRYLKQNHKIVDSYQKYQIYIKTLFVEALKIHHLTGSQKISQTKKDQPIKKESG